MVETFDTLAGDSNEPPYSPRAEAFNGLLVSGQSLSVVGLRLCVTIFSRRSNWPLSNVFSPSHRLKERVMIVGHVILIPIVSFSCHVVGISSIDFDETKQIISRAVARSSQTTQVRSGRVRPGKGKQTRSVRV